MSTARPPETSPPDRARRWLARLLPSAERERLLEFFEEIHRVRAREGSRRDADRWYWRQVLLAPGRVWSARIRRGASDTGDRMGSLMYELRHALRRMVRAPAFSAIVLITLGLGIGATTSVYSLVKGVLLDPLPYPDSERLVSLWHTAPGLGLEEFEQSEATYLFYRDRSRTLEELGIWAWRTANLRVEGQDAERVVGAAVSASLLDVLGVVPALGRPFLEADETPGADPVVLLGHDAWQRLYGGDGGIVGERIELSDRPAEIIGVLPAGFRFPDPGMEYLVPYRFDHASPEVPAFFLQGIGRRAPGASVADVQEELGQLLHRLPERYPHELMDAEAIRRARMDARVYSLAEQVVGEMTGVLWTLLATVGFVLLAACANVANLFLVRTESRGREVAVRAALGAGRSGMVRFFLAESLLLTATGGLLGVALAGVAVRLLVTRSPVEIPRLQEVAVDGGVLLFALGVVAVAGVVFGVYPVLRYGGTRLLEGLREGGRTLTGASTLKIRHGLVVAQVALALVLLVGSILMARSFWNLAGVDPGFEAEGVLTTGVSFSGAAYEGQEDVADAFQRLIGRLESAAGVDSAAAVSAPPLTGGAGQNAIWVEGHSVAEGELPRTHVVRFASPGYFRTMGVPLLQGRGFEPRDQEDLEPVAVVSESMAELYWPEGDALDGRLARGPRSSWHRVVGVVGDVRSAGLDEPSVPTVYLPMTGPVGDPGYDFYPRSFSVVVRGGGDPTALMPVIRAELRQIDPAAPLFGSRTMEQIVSGSLARVTFTMVTLALAAGVALLLGAIGIYGVISWLIGQRTREIGVRLALGAGRARVRRMVVRQGLGLAGAGLLLGLAVSLALGRMLAFLLYEVGPLDPLALAGATLVLLAACLLACWLPARRAAAVSPGDVLRS